MDEKRAMNLPMPNMAHHHHHPIPHSCRSSRQRSRFFVVLIILGLGLYAYSHIQPLSRIATDHHYRWQQQQQQQSSAMSPFSRPSEQQPFTSQNALVPLEAHIMSKCPDAKDCLRELVLPAMQRVHDKVNFTLSFLGTPTDADDGVACKHGPEECLGNIIELCAQRLYPDPKTFLGFTMCLTKEYKLIPQRSLVEDCALEHAIDFSELNKCATKDDGAFGIGMLRESVRRTSEVRHAQH
ncbi:hypothetical protein QBC46DRAFT_386816 [Diplogelasinospora grovesii]|uniref:Gamma interferon inducible lysosomal thiol reductase n=1 Tax=Diplogelasinospora grovesii TaxID=303347 RepID=A0AAN6N9S5_9PEZI|nr:hypothetical protein QBC46DRAFT_386816 [Diplogelasinospora grovesii]